VRYRLPVALAVTAAAAAILASASPAQTSPSAKASAAVVSGTLGTVAPVSVSGNDDASRSAPTKTPDGINLGGGSATASSSLGSGDALAQAQAEAHDVSLLGGVVTADAVSRTAQADGKGHVSYDGSVSGLQVGDEKIGDVSSDKRYDLPDGAGFVEVNHDGDGLHVELTGALDDFEVGTTVIVAKVGASARDGKVAPTPTPTATPTPKPTAVPTTTPSKPSKPRQPAYKKRLMGTQWIFPVAGKTTIGGPFGAARADTGFHEGNDLFAGFGTPVVAVADGTVENVGSLKISGNRLWVYADTGDQFFYAHLSAFAPAAVDHTHVAAGTVLGYVGNTGDAEPTPPHLHFEIHPNGGAAVDPHPFLVVWQRRAGKVTSDTAQRPGALVEVRDLIGDS
jgi:murein DD-endopeptidase MepM/ murein hydrolase activator NlpD